jgi:tetratricopeptide (TPR) repeat protein
VAFEYFRLAAGAEPATAMRPVRDAVRAWVDKGVTAEQAGQVNAIFQIRLAGRVKELLAKESPDFRTIATECAADPANGWAAAAKAEALLATGNRSEAVTFLPAAAKAKPREAADLGAYLEYLNGVAEASNPVAAADRFVAAFKSMPADLKTAGRVTAGRNTLLAAAEPKLTPVLANPPRVELTHPRAAAWLATVEGLNPDRRALVFCALARAEQKSASGLKAVIDRLQASGENEDPLRAVPNLLPAHKVLFGLARASLIERRVDAGRLAIYGDVAWQLVTWFGQASDELHTRVFASGQKPDESAYDAAMRKLRENVVDLLDGWADVGSELKITDTTAMEARKSHALVLTARGALYARFPQTFKDQFVRGWREYQSALQVLGRDATADIHAYGALLSYGYFLREIYQKNRVPVGPKDPVEAEVWQAWGDIFRRADAALGARRTHPIANEAIGSAMSWVALWPPIARVHDAAIANDPAGAAARLAPAGRDTTEYARDFITRAVENTTRRHDASSLKIMTEYLFLATAKRALVGLPPAVVRQNMEAVERFGAAILSHQPLDPAQIHNMIGLALEDSGWMAARGSEREFSQAVAALTKAKDLVRPSDANPKPVIRYASYLNDLGRCQYRAAVHRKSGRFTTAAARTTLELAASQLREVIAKDQSNEDRQSATVAAAEVYYWLGMTYWAGNDYGKAETAFLDAAATFDKTPNDWGGLALYDLARMNRDRDSGKKTAEEIAGYATRLDAMTKVKPSLALRAYYVRTLSVLEGGNRQAATSQFEALLRAIEKDVELYKGGWLPRRATADVTYVHALGELLALWANQTGEMTAQERADRVKAFRDGCETYPWVLTVEERETLQAVADGAK